MCVRYWWNDTDGKAKYSEKPLSKAAVHPERMPTGPKKEEEPLSQCHFVHQKRRNDWSGFSAARRHLTDSYTLVAVTNYLLYGILHFSSC